ncbi:CvpA family protein [Shinella sp.]|uniref:CvpA family protein n=1 Tax=Shinella sp. TaxID=1870904 RepID=UPI0029B624CA|nr:CvpA family protein [Shinella sp.]MDX3973151.1 CvpA family protein [Shinella sp.]
MPITILDGIVIGVALFSAVLAMVRGFSREVLSVASWVGAAAAAYFLYPVLLPYAKDYTTSDTVAMVGSAAAVFLVALIVISFITMRIADFIIDSRIGALDRTLGFLFGAARGILLVVVAMLFFNWLVAPQQQPGWVTTAKSKPLLDNLGSRLVALLPEDADATILDRLRGKPVEGQPTEGEGSAEDPDGATGGTGQGTTGQTPAEEVPATNG